MKLGSTFVVMMKEKGAEWAYDISIIPPYSFKNALPCSVRFRRHGDYRNELLNVGEYREIYASCNLPVSLELILPGYVSAIFQFAKDKVILS